MSGVVLWVACLGVLAAALGVAAATDLSCRIVPNGCVAAIAASALVRALLAPASGGGRPVSLPAALAGGALVLAVMLAAALLSARGGRAPGVGGGDVKLLSSVGVWVGPLGGLLVVALSCLVGLLGWLIASVRSSRGERPTGIPLAPAVAMVALPVVLAGFSEAAATL